MQTEQLLCWSGMIDIEHCTIYGSNEEEEEYKQNNFSIVQKIYKAHPQKLRKMTLIIYLVIARM